MRDEEDRIRSIAGYLVKNNSRVSLMPSPEVAELVKSSVIKALNDSNAMIRDTADQDFVADPRTEELARVHAVVGSDAGHGSGDEIDRQEVSGVVLFSAPHRCSDAMPRPHAMSSKGHVKTIPARWT